MFNKQAAQRFFVASVITAGLSLSFPAVANADTLSDLYGVPYDRMEVFVGEDASGNSDELSVASELDESSNEIATYATQSVSPRSITDEMLYFCAWESGQNYDQGLSWGDNYHAMGYFQFDNRYDLSAFLQAVYNYNPSKYSALAVLGTNYGWDLKGATRADGAFTQLGNDLNDAWHACYNADPTEFAQLQNGWAYDNYYVPAANYLRSRGIPIDNRSDSVKSLCWGMSNLFGLGGWRLFVGGVTSGYDWNGSWNSSRDWPGAGLRADMSDSEFVATLCDYVVDNVSVFFKAQPQYWIGWQNRYRDEKAHYLGILGDPADQVQYGEKYINGKWYYFDPANGGAMATGFVTLPDGRLVYYAEDGAMAHGEARVGGCWYHFDEHDGRMSTGLTRLPDGRTVLYSGEGRMLYGLQEVSGSRRFFDSHTGNMARGALCSADGRTFYADAGGSLASGERCVSGKWYYFDPANGGAMATGFVTLPDGRLVYYAEDGAMAHGEARVGGCWYHFDEHDGRMSTGLTRLPDGRTVLYSGEGRMLYGLQEVSGSRRFFDSHTGNMARNQWVDVDGSGSLSFANNEGLLVAHARITESGKYRFYNDDGSPAVGWQRINETAFYCDANGDAVTGEKQIDGYWYHFDENNAAMSMGLVTLKDGRRVYYSSVGRMQYGEQRINGSWYYFDDVNGAMTFGWKYLTNGSKWVWYGPSGDTGKMRYGWQSVDGVQRYFDVSTGSCDKIGYQTPNGYHRVSTRSVSMPSYVGGGRFSYVTPSRIGVNATREECIETMIGRAFEYLNAGTPYIWDYACAPGVGVDCAGLVMQCLYATGMDLGYFNPWDHYYTPGHDHYANDMWNDPQFVHADFSDRRRGDLVCYSGHIAIYLGNDQIIEAASARIGLRVSSVYSSSGIKGVLRPFA